MIFYLVKSYHMKLFYLPVFLMLFSCSGNNSNTREQTDLKIKVLRERGDSIEKANVNRGKTQ